MCQDLQLGESVVVNPLDLAVFHGNFIEMKETNRAETVLGELLDVVPVHVENLQPVVLLFQSSQCWWDHWPAWLRKL